ncbi:MAG: prepilin-type N-terminal cleavage/methylation domain-containing protein [Phycisphaeraceae bacterium]|nr:prepilin-type N-terminal cleavage/methylation domain-containing protein [Phycisphaeraceae bacterium]MCW5755052.1 prepilin-type N-terminal cleavage/methylation domain-containing protein [Phycisphaeraceae bacterium]
MRIRPVPVVRGKPDGFTLIELLVVVSIVALLLGIVLPALSGAREAARAAGCLANHRQVATIITMYADQNDGRTPALGWPWTTTPFWALVVQEEAGRSGEGPDLYSRRSILVCPSARRVYGDEIERTLAMNVTGLAGEPGDVANFDVETVSVRLDRVQFPSDTPMLVDSAAAVFDSNAPPPTRTVGTLDFRNPVHVQDRLGWYHGGLNKLKGTQFHAAMYDASAQSHRTVSEDWRRRLP